MSIGTKFESFCSNILIAQDTVEDISYRYKRITKQLNKDFWETESETAHSLYVGSYGRDTDIHVSDVDMLFQLPYAVYERISQHSGNGQSALLQEVKSSIENTYKSYVRADGQVVKVDFTDGVSFEIIPCFINKD
ncbi:MAG: nucleotidyltransferase, partial [Candidatus Margulisiibacteriota bacterium]